MTGARKRTNVLWQADGPDWVKHAYVIRSPDAHGHKRIEDRSVCGLPRPAKPSGKGEECRPCRVSLGRTW